MVVVPDASIAWEYLCNTAVGKRASHLLDQAELAAPTILDLEVLSITRRLVMTEQIGTESGDALLRRLESWDIERIPIWQLTTGALQMRDNFSAADALYVLVARAFNAQLVTCDRKLAQAPKLGISVRYIEVECPRFRRHLRFHTYGSV